MTPTMEMRRAVKSRDWIWAEQVASERMFGSTSRNWLRKIDRLRLIEAAQLYVCRKAGPLRNGCELGHGGIWHAVPGEPHLGAAALCGDAPAIMWSGWAPTGQHVTCQRCLKLAEEIFPDKEVRPAPA